MSGEQFQLRFDGGHQQRYFSDRRDLLACVLRVSTQSPDPRFEVWGQGEPVQLANGRKLGRQFEIREVLDLSEDGVRERIEAELAGLEIEGRAT